MAEPEPKKRPVPIAPPIAIIVTLRLFNPRFNFGFSFTVIPPFLMNKEIERLFLQ